MSPGDVTLRIGGLSRPALREALEAADVHLNPLAEQLLEDPAVADGPEQRIVVTRRRVAQLGLPHGGTLPQLLVAAESEGLRPCPPHTGPFLRLALRDQGQAPDSVLSAGRAPAGALHVLSVRLRADPEHPAGFYLRVVDGVTWLRGFRCDDTYVWPSDSELALRVPEAQEPGTDAW